MYLWNLLIPVQTSLKKNKREKGVPFIINAVIETITKVVRDKAIYKGNVNNHFSSAKREMFFWETFHRLKKKQKSPFYK